MTTVVACMRPHHRPLVSRLEGTFQADTWYGLVSVYTCQACLDLAIAWSPSSQLPVWHLSRLKGGADRQEDNNEDSTSFSRTKISPRKDLALGIGATCTLGICDVWPKQSACVVIKWAHHQASSHVEDSTWGAAEVVHAKRESRSRCQKY